jgi:hypothetical protein
MPAAGCRATVRPAAAAAVPFVQFDRSPACDVQAARPGVGLRGASVAPARSSPPRLAADCRAFDAAPARVAAQRKAGMLSA